MLKRIERERDGEGARVLIRDANFPGVFSQGLEYSSPARGTWNIVHTGMLIPESHQIFVCAQGCLRGVVLTAAEMNALDRYSAVLIREEQVLNGDMEELMIEGVTDVLRKLPKKPRAVLLFISCQHFFLAYDQNLVFETLRERFPQIDFTDCYMIPTLRKSGLTPDQKMRVQMYSLLTPGEKNPRKINLIGSNLPIRRSSELVQMLKDGGYELQMVNWCHTYEDYLAMAEASYNLYYEPLAKMAGEDLKKRLGQENVYVPFTYDYEELDDSYKGLAGELGIALPDVEGLRRKAEGALWGARAIIGDTKISVDAAFTFRILSFTRWLLTHGFCVREIYADAFLPEEEKDFRWIQEHYPEIVITSCIRPEMRFLNRERGEKILAVGQKAAYFTGTDYFVNVAESGGFYGYEGMAEIADLMVEAFLEKKDRKTIIQRKGYGCESCI